MIARSLRLGASSTLLLLVIRVARVENVVSLAPFFISEKLNFYLYGTKQPKPIKKQCFYHFEMDFCSNFFLFSIRLVNE